MEASTLLLSVLSIGVNGIIEIAHRSYKGVLNGVSDQCLACFVNTSGHKGKGQGYNKKPCTCHNAGKAQRSGENDIVGNVYVVFSARKDWERGQYKGYCKNKSQNLFHGNPPFLQKKLVFGFHYNEKKGHNQSLVFKGVFRSAGKAGRRPPVLTPKICHNDFWLVFLAGGFYCRE
jgi:hypothetical protein